MSYGHNKISNVKARAIRLLYKDKGRTQKEAAKGLGLSMSTIARYWNRPLAEPVGSGGKTKNAGLQSYFFTLESGRARAANGAAKHDPVNHPPHYTGHASGVECIEITEHLNFCLGNAMKYLWRAGLKNDAIEDLKKARWYIDREIARLEASASKRQS